MFSSVTTFIFYSSIYLFIYLSNFPHEKNTKIFAKYKKLNCHVEAERRDNTQSMANIKIIEFK